MEKQITRILIVFCIVWMVLMILFDQPNYTFTDAEMWVESLKWGLP